MFTAANVLSILRSLFRLLARRRAKDTTGTEITAVMVTAVAPVTAAATVTAGTPEGRKVVRAGFNMQAEIAKLAERIVEPVAANLAMQELEHVVERIRAPTSKILPSTSLSRFSQGLVRRSSRGSLIGSGEPWLDFARVTGAKAQPINGREHAGTCHRPRERAIQ